MTQTIGNAVAQRDEQEERSPRAFVMRYRDEFTKVLPTHLRSEAEQEAWLRLAVGSLKTGRMSAGEYDLEVAARNNPQAFMQALRKAASLGLQPGTEAFYLTPRKVKGRLEILGITGYQGIIELMYRAGYVASVVCEVVHQTDTFRFSPGRDERPIHEVDWFAEDRGPVIGAYGYAIMHGGVTSRVVVLSEAQIQEIRKKYSQGSDSEYSPWQTNPDAMRLKGLALDTPIPTPTGWTTMSAVRPGDQVFDMHGQPTRVTAKSDVKMLDCYRVTFANGASITCDSEHVWLATIGRNGARERRRNGWAVVTTAELYAAKERGERVVMPVAGPLATPVAELPIDPWVLGYWLGNGHHASGRVTCHIDHCDEVMAAVARAGYGTGVPQRRDQSKGVTFSVKGLVGQLRTAGVLENKHVPSAYLRSAPAQRLALLRGLMDSDGTLGNNRGAAVFMTVKEGLTAAVAELARSLGETVNGRSYMAKGFGKEVLCHQVRWQPTIEPVTIASKRVRFKDRQVSSYRSVKSVEKVASVPTQCIAVDAETRTYLASRDMVPTHNTIVRRLKAWVPTSVEVRGQGGLPVLPPVAATTLATAPQAPVLPVGHAPVPESEQADIADPEEVIDGEIVEESAAAAQTLEGATPVAEAPVSPEPQKGPPARTARKAATASRQRPAPVDLGKLFEQKGFRDPEQRVSYTRVVLEGEDLAQDAALSAEQVTKVIEALNELADVKQDG